LWILLGSPGSRLPEDIHSVDTMKGTSVSECLQYAAYDLGFSSQSLNELFQRLAVTDSTSVEFSNASEEDRLISLLDSINKALMTLRCHPDSSKIETNLPAELDLAMGFMCNAHDRFCEFLFPDDLEKAEISVITKEVDAILETETPGITQKKLELWKRLTNSQNESPQEVPLAIASFRKLTQALRKLELSLPPFLMPYFVLGKWLPDAHMCTANDLLKKLSPGKILSLKRKMFGNELPKLLADCRHHNAEFQPSLPENILQVDFRKAIKSVREVVETKLDELASPQTMQLDAVLESETLEWISKCIDEGNEADRVTEEGDIESSVNGAGTADSSWLQTVPESQDAASNILSRIKKIEDGFEMLGVRVELNGECMKLLEYFLKRKNFDRYMDYAELKKAYATQAQIQSNSNRSSKHKYKTDGTIKNDLSTLRNRLRQAFDLAECDDPIPTESKNRYHPATWKLDLYLLEKQAKSPND
jgi:hypothetical protein